MKSKNILAGIVCIPLICNTILNPKNANAATRISFARGSYCGYYSGDFSREREFVLSLAGGQTFTSRNTGSGLQYDIYVQGPTGYIYGSRASLNQINYQIPVSGDYYVYIRSNTPYNSVEFCAY